MTTLVGVRRALQGSVGSVAQGGAPGVPNPTFWVPFSDAGAGAVNLNAYRGAPGTVATFTRASVAWTKLSTGLWAQIATGVARSGYLSVGAQADSAVGVYGGLFAESAGTQLVTPTASIRDMTDASWVKVTMTTAKTSTGIDGVASSCTRVTASGANATILQTLVAAATLRTYSCFIKRVTGVGEIDISEDGSTWTNITAQINSSTFTRVSVSVSQLNAAFGLRIVTSTDAIDVDFNQFEAGAFATSPMASAGAARNGDILVYPSAGNFNAAQGTVAATFVAPLNTGVGRLLIDISSASVPLETLTGVEVLVNDGTTSVQTAGTASRTAMNKAASTWSGALEVAYINGGGAVSGAFDGSMNIGASIDVASDNNGANALNGYIRDLKLWPFALSATQIAAL